MTNDEMFAKALEQALDEEIAECAKLPDHNFSRRFDRKMKNLLRSGIAEDHQTSSARVGRRLPIAVIVVIATFLLMGAAATYCPWNNFRLQDRGLYTLLHITNVDDCPKTLEERYMLTADLSGFTENIIVDTYYDYTVEYRNSENTITITFEQIVKNAAQNIFINTENATVLQEIDINGCNGIYFVTQYHDGVLFWDTGAYIIQLSSNGIGEYELFSLTQFVQKVE